MTILPQDTFDRTIPALRLKPGAAHSIAAGASSARNSTGFGDTTRIISLYATTPVFLRFGGSGVTAAPTDHYFPDGLYYDVAIGGDEATQYKHVAVIRAGSTDGTVYISEKE